jgi:hypothetical protein
MTRLILPAILVFTIGILAYLAAGQHANFAEALQVIEATQ